jgi:hypothetical protein
LLCDQQGRHPLGKADTGTVDALRRRSGKYAPFPHPTGSSRENNVEVPFGIFDLGQHGNVSDPARRFAFFIDGQAFFAAELPDFLNDRDWRSKLVKADGTFSPRLSRLNFWDDQHQEWVTIVQNAVPHWLPTREIARFSSPDLKQWRSEIVLTPDPADPHEPGRYDEPMMLYPYYTEGVVLGLLSWFHGDRTSPDGGPVLDKDSSQVKNWKQGWPWPTTADNPFVWPWARRGVNELRITISRDGGRTWDRTSSRQAWIPHGTEDNSYDRLAISPIQPVWSTTKIGFMSASSMGTTSFLARIRSGLPTTTIGSGWDGSPSTRKSTTDSSVCAPARKWRR